MTKKERETNKASLQIEKAKDAFKGAAFGALYGMGTNKMKQILKAAYNAGQLDVEKRPEELEDDWLFKRTKEIVDRVGYVKVVEGKDRDCINLTEDSCNILDCDVNTHDECVFIDFRNKFYNAQDAIKIKEMNILHDVLESEHRIVYVNDDVLEKITKVCPLFFDGLEIEQFVPFVPNSSVVYGKYVPKYMKPAAKSFSQMIDEMLSEL